MGEKCVSVKEKQTMQLPLTDPDSLFEELLQDLPPEVSSLAREHKAFVRAKKVQTPEQLLRIVLLYCGLDHPLRTVAGMFTALYEPITDQSVAERLRACGPWVQAPGATGTDHRLHICMDLVFLEFVEVLVTDVHGGETLKHFTLSPGDVVVADRGYSHPHGLHAAVQQGAELIVRLNPFRVVLTPPAGQPLVLGAALKRQWTETIRTLSVVIRSADGQHEVRGWVHAYRLSPEQANRARQKCRQRHKNGAPKAETLFLAGWVLVFTTLAPTVLSAATILAIYRCRWQSEIAIMRWKCVLDVAALRAKAQSPLADVWLHGKLLYALLLERRLRRTRGESWGRLDQARGGTWWRLWGMLKEVLAPMITGALFWKEEAWAACLKAVAERPRRRKLQQLPSAAIALLYRRAQSKQEELPLAA
jgi:hypothetical protein